MNCDFSKYDNFKLFYLKARSCRDTFDTSSKEWWRLQASLKNFRNRHFDFYKKLEYEELEEYLDESVHP